MNDRRENRHVEDGMGFAGLVSSAEERREEEREARLQDELTRLRNWRDEATAACAKRRCATMQRDRDEAEAQRDDLLDLARRVADHFAGTDAPLGSLARMLLRNAGETA